MAASAGDLPLVPLASPAAISVRNLSLSYGSKHALNGLNLEAPRGSIYGLLGASGSGKTSLIRCILGVLKYSSGCVRVFGQAAGSAKSAIPGAGVGYMPQDITLYDDLTVKETLQYFGALFGMSDAQIDERSEFLIDFLGLSDLEKRLIRNLSGGQKRRVSLATALIHKPPLLILDEPTVGVDPLLRYSIWRHLTDLSRTEQLTVLITTHYIEEARDASRVGLMRDGVMLAEESPGDLLERFNRPSLEDVFLYLCTEADEKRQRAIEGVPEQVLSPRPVSRHTSRSHSPPPLAEDLHPPGHLNCSCSSDNQQQQQQLTTFVDRKPVGWIQQVWAMVSKNVKTTMRNKWLMAFNFMLPTLEVILFCACIGLNLHSIEVAVYDGDQSAMSQSILASLDSHVIRCTMFPTAEDAIAAVRAGKATTALTMNANFTHCLFERMTKWADNLSPEVINNSTIHLFPDMANQLMVHTVLTEVTRVFIDVGKQVLDALGANPAILEMPITMEAPVYGVKNAIYRDYMAPGMILSIAFLSAIPLTAMVLVVERKHGLVERSMVAGSSYLRIMIALLLPQVVILFFSSLALMIFVFPIFGIPYHGEFALVLLLTFTQSLCGMCFGLFVSTLAKDENTATMMALGFFYPNLLLSGTVWPVEAMSDWIQSFSQVLPQTLAIGSMRHMIARGWSLYNAEVICGFAVTALWIGIFLVASMLAYKCRLF